MAPNNLQQLQRQYLEYLEIEKGRSQRTIIDYDHYLSRFINWAQIAEPSQITLEKVRQYRLWLNRQIGTNNQPLQKNTQNYHLIAVRNFLKYLAKIDVTSLAAEKIELAKMPARQVEFLDKEELKRILSAPNQMESSEIIKQRDQAILELLFSTGLRVSELVNLKKENINLNPKLPGTEIGEFTVRGKGSKLRIVFLSGTAREALKKYLARRTDVSPFLFIRHDSANQQKDLANLTARSVQRLIEKYAKACGITKKVTPHTLRHSYATDLLLNGADIRSVQSLLGHSSITTTQIYTHITNKHLKEVFKTFHDK